MLISGLKFRGEGMPVHPGVAVHDVDLMDLVKMVLERVGAENIRHARIEAASEKGHEICPLEPLVVGPLPLVREGRFIGRLVVCRVEVMTPVSRHASMIERSW